MTGGFSNNEDTSAVPDHMTQPATLGVRLEVLSRRLHTRCYWSGAVAGGNESIHSELATAELYDPATGNWSQTEP